MATGDRILVVDDDAPVCRLFTRVLSRKRYQVEGVLTAPHAMKVAARLRPDLVILDGYLSGTTGTALLKEMRLQLQLSQMRALFVTGRADRAAFIRETSAEQPTPRVLYKPIPPAELLDAVHEELRIYRRVRNLDPRPNKLFDIDDKNESVWLAGSWKHVPDVPRRLFAVLASVPNAFVSNDRLIEEVWHGTGDQHLLLVTLSRLREALGSKDFIESNLDGTSTRLRVPGLPEEPTK